MYEIINYGRMIADRVRMEAYVEALRRTIRAGAVVVDLGSGPGTLALLACKLGAARVYAVDPADVVHLAAETAAANGFGDRVEIFHGPSTEFAPAERADVVVSDLRGVLPFFDHHLPTICDARRRLLRPGGQLIPELDTVWATVVEAPELYGELVEPWTAASWELNQDSVRTLAVNCWRRGRVEREQQLAEARPWVEVDYRRVADANAAAALSYRVERAGTGHGLCLWFDATLVAGVGFSTAPWDPELIYGNAFFPFTAPLELVAGDLVEVDLRATLVGSHYVWTWATTARRGASELARFRQSSFLGEALAPDRLRRRAHTHRPALNREGRVQSFILRRMDGGSTVGEIADALRAEFPELFPDHTLALTRVGELSDLYR